MGDLFNGYSTGAFYDEMFAAPGQPHPHYQRLYERLGWVKVGDVPEFALYPNGGYCSTTYYYRKIGT